MHDKRIISSIFATFLCIAINLSPWGLVLISIFALLSSSNIPETTFPHLHNPPGVVYCNNGGHFVLIPEYFGFISDFYWIIPGTKFNMNYYRFSIIYKNHLNNFNLNFCFTRTRYRSSSLCPMYVHPLSYPLDNTDI